MPDPYGAAKGGALRPMSLLTRSLRYNPADLERAGRSFWLRHWARHAHTLDLRREAIRALGRLRDRRARRLLLRALDHPALREAAAEALAEIGVAAAAPRIAAHLADPQEAPWAERALRELRWEPPPGTLAVWLAVRRGQWERVLSLRPYATAPLLTRLSEPEAEPAAELLFQLGWVPRRNALGVRYALLRHDYTGAAALGEGAVEPLLATEAPDAALLAAWERAGDTAVDGLIVALRAAGLPRRPLVAEALGRSGARRATQPLVSALSDPALSAAAARALGALGDPDAVSPLYHALQGPAPREAAQALAKIGGSKGIHLLISALPAAPVPLRVAAISALASAGDPRAVRPLIPFLRDPHSLVRMHTARALGTLGTRGAAPELAARAVGDPSEDVQLAAAQALGEIGDGAALPVLLAVVRGPAHNRVRRAAAEAIASLSDLNAEQHKLRWDAALELALLGVLAPTNP